LPFTCLPRPAHLSLDCPAIFGLLAKDKLFKVNSPKSLVVF
jgi:hypothetical protein